MAKVKDKNIIERKVKKRKGNLSDLLLLIPEKKSLQELPCCF
jgi:hypothetical protein